MKRALAVLIVQLTCLLACRIATAAAWSEGSPQVRRDLDAGKPLVVHVMVPLCDNEQIVCGSDALGSPGSLGSNLYWGALFGAKRFFDKRSLGWERLSTSREVDGVLERAVYRRTVEASAWSRPIEQIVILDAVHGGLITGAVREFFRRAAHGGEVGFHDGKRTRTARVHVMGYAGHNRLMDGIQLPELRRKRSVAVPSFVLACRSDSYFSSSLEKAGSEPLVMTRSLMAPEGYVIEAVVRGLGDNLSSAQLTQRAIASYARWQRISHATATRIFAH